VADPDLHVALPGRRVGGHAFLQVSAAVDYGVRALCVLADRGGGPVTAKQLAEAEGIPPKFLEAILNDLGKGGVVVGRRGSNGGYSLSRAAEQITLREVLEPLVVSVAEVRGGQRRTENGIGSSAHVLEVWNLIKRGLQQMLDTITVADILIGKLPDEVTIGRVVGGDDGSLADPHRKGSKSVASARPCQRPSPPAMQPPG